MLHFFLLLLYIIFVCMLPIKKKQICLILCLIPLFLFIVFQNGWTPDNKSYESEFIDAHTNWLFNIYSLKGEYGFALLCAIMPSFRLLVAFQMALFSFALYIIFNNYIPKKYWIISFIICWTDFNFMIMSLSAMRSCIAGSIFIIAMHLRFKEYKILPILMVVPLFFIHKTSTILIPFLILSKNMSKRNLAILYGIVLAFIIIIFINPSAIFSKVSVFLSDNDNLGYNSYIAESSGGGINPIVLLLTTSCLIYIMYMNMKMKNTYKDHVDFNYICAMLLFFFQLSGIPMVTRFTVFFGPFALICYVDMLRHDKKTAPFFVSYVILYNFYYLVFFLPKMGAWETLSEYHSILVITSLLY